MNNYDRVEKCHYNKDNGGGIFYICYFCDKKYHRTDGPAAIFYYKNGVVSCEQYMLNGLLHREDGIAYISYAENSDVKEVIYYYKGEIIKVNSLKEYLEFVENEKLKEYLG
jgi:hypothetical protein